MHRAYWQWRGLQDACWAVDSRVLIPSLKKRNVLGGYEVGSILRTERESEAEVVTMVGCWVSPAFQVLMWLGGQGALSILG